VPRSLVTGRPGLALLAQGLRGSRGPALRIAGWSALEAAPALASGWVTAAALDRGFLRDRPGTGLAWLGLLAALYLVRAAAGRAMFADLAHVVEPLRDTLVRRVVEGSLARSVTGGRPVDAAGVSRLSSQVDGVRGVVGTLLRTARPLAVTLVATVAGLAALSPLLALLVLVPLAAAVAAFAVTVRALTTRRRTQVVAEEEVAARGGEVLAAVRDTTALGAEAYAAGTVRRAADASADAAVSVSRAAAMRAPLVLLGGYLPLLLLLWTGPHLVDRGAVSAGDVVGAATYLTAHLVPALRMMTGLVGGYWTQLRIVLDRLAEATAVPRPPRRPRAPHTGGLDLTAEGLTFAYGPHAEPVLRDLDLTVPYGDHLAVVGPSGIGKSTLAGLLAGIEEPTRGAVRIGGTPVADLPEPVRCGLIALVPQEAYVFPGTLLENLRYLCPTADRAAVEEAVAAVGLGATVRRLGGLDAPIADPATLSSGERQLVVLARAYASPATVTVLDEATCHLDMEAEARVERAFAARPGTLVIIAHRLSSATRARRVLLLDGDRPVLGPHAALLSTSTEYAELFGHWAPPVPAVT
jgi:ATP-binding cassette, subfamily C, bacterial